MLTPPPHAHHDRVGQCVWLVERVIDVLARCVVPGEVDEEEGQPHGTLVGVCCPIWLIVPEIDEVSTAHHAFRNVNVPSFCSDTKSAIQDSRIAAKSRFSSSLFPCSAH